MVDGKQLIEKLQKATEPSKALDEEIAIAAGVWHPWLSKNRRWNFTPSEALKREGIQSFSWPADPIPQFDVDTGRKIVLTETPWSGWGWTAQVPDYTTSIHFAQELLPEGYAAMICTDPVKAAVTNAQALDDHWYEGALHYDACEAATPVLALCIACLKTREAA